MYLTLAAILPLTLAAATEGGSYADAHKVTAETGKPLMVMVSTEWCPPCRQMKKAIIPQVREDGFLRKVAFAVVNPDQDQELAQQITGGGPIPQLVVYCKTRHGWTRKKLVGGQSVEKVEEFINAAVAEASEKGKPDQASPPEESSKAQPVSTPAQDLLMIFPATLH